MSGAGRTVTPTSRATIVRVRVTLSGLGVAAVIGLGVAGRGPATSALSVVAVGALVMAAAVLVEETRARSSQKAAGVEPMEAGEAGASEWTRSSSPVAAPANRPRDGRTTARRPVARTQGWRSAGSRWALAVAVVTLVFTQTWFRPGTALAGGDVAPPVGTAWLERLFDPWVWAGSSLGSPNRVAELLPWAVVDATVHALGGSGALAQRCWLSGLLVAAALGAFWLLRTLGLEPSASAVGALVYVYNPYVLSTVGVNAVYLAAMVLLAIWPTVVLNVARGKWTRRRGLAVFVFSAPLAGFVYQNPPLVGLCILGVGGAALVAVWLEHDVSPRRLAGFVGGAFVAVALGSAYWLVPAIAQLHFVSGALTSSSRWSWTEGRATLANGLWLNTAWGWAHPTYFPYEGLFGEFPLSLVKYLLPAGAFSSVLLARPFGGASERRRAKLAAGAALTALFLIIFGTGTNQPGAVIFDPLYRLPFGWLLQEPGRFLMAAALAYAAMLSVTVTEIAQRLHRWSSSRHVASSVHRWLRLLPGTLIVLVALIVSFPTVAGALTPRYGERIPASHVAVPHYWGTLAGEIERSSPHATILVLPPDDFYQMPYQWGYYGNDSFIENLLSERVVDPAAQGYFPSSSALLRATRQVAGALVAHRWQLADDILGAIGANEVLLRGDIDPALPGRNIVAPRVLRQALRLDPEMRRVVGVGPLSVFRVRQTESHTAARVVTVNRAAPDLAVLSSLPRGTVLVSRPPLLGATSVLQPPPLTSWPVVDGALRVSMSEPAGWHYHLEVLPSLSSWPPVQAAPARPTVTTLGDESNGARRVELRVALPHNLAPDGGFRGGQWGGLRNCDAVPGTVAATHLSARVRPAGGPGAASPALELGTNLDRACESDVLRWKHGPLLVGFDYRAISGLPGICLWEVGPDTCLPTPPLETGKGWHHQLFEVQPASKTSQLMLFLYATPSTPGQPALDEYANILVTRLPGTGQPVLVGLPARGAVSTRSATRTALSSIRYGQSTRSAADLRLVVSPNGVGSPLSAPEGATAVRADGLRAAWMITGPVSHSIGAYRWAAAFRDGWLLSGGVGGLTLVLSLVILVAAVRRSSRAST